jgi:hypothetical protein
MGSCTDHPNIRARKDGLCDECLAAAEAKGGQPRNPSPPPAGDPAAPKKGRRPRQLKAPVEAGAVLKIDFSGHKEILDLIGEMAANQFRSVEGQILFLLAQATQADD